MPNELKIDLIELVRRAYMMGFCASSEGYNGEYPFSEDLEEVGREMAPNFEADLPKILEVVAKEDGHA